MQRFYQSVDHQFSTIFGLDQAADVGHYYVATDGNVNLTGWLVRFDGPLVPYVRGTIAYSSGEAYWTNGPEALGLAQVEPAAVRDSRERLQNLSASVEANVPETATWVSVAYRVSNAFSGAGLGNPAPTASARFDVQLRQGLPYHPLHTGKTEFLLAVRNLFRDLSQTGSAYDELLTVAPPLRVMGGIQVEF